MFSGLFRMVRDYSDVTCVKHPFCVAHGLKFSDVLKGFLIEAITS